MMMVSVDSVDNQFVKNAKGKVAKFRLWDADLQNIAAGKLAQFMDDLDLSDLEEIS
jgi:hypothetical protein